MTFRAQFACLLGGLFALLVGVSAYQYAHAAQDRGSSWPKLPVPDDPYSEAERRWEELCRFDGVLIARMAERRELVHQVRDGQISLFAAAAEFKRLNSLGNPSKFDPLLTFPGASQNEKLCRQVIVWLQQEMDGLPPRQRQLIIDRLEEDLCDHLGRNGTVILPED
jgi:hypothetical protein